jgi:predicted RNA-binding protein YlxR (DUF448 family)
LTSAASSQPFDKGKRSSRGLSAHSSRHHSPVAATVRTCIGCRQSETRDNLLRLVATPDGRIAFDLAGGSFGRGAWVHARTDCLAKSVRGLGRALRAPITASLLEIYQGLLAAAWRRAESLTRSAKRAGHLLIGAEAGSLVWRTGKVAIAVVAEDARAGALVPWVRDALQAGCILFGPPKSILGKWCGHEQVAIAAITDSGLAKALARAIAIAQIPDPTLCREAERGTEVG